MPNTDNLIPQAHKLTVEEASKGGKASAESRRQKKLLRECLTELLDRVYESNEGLQMTGAERISARLFRSALEGDNKAFEIIRDTVGEKPRDSVEIRTIDPQVRREMDALMGLDG